MNEVYNKEIQRLGILWDFMIKKKSMKKFYIDDVNLLFSKTIDYL